MEAVIKNTLSYKDILALIKEGKMWYEAEACNRNIICL